MLRLLVVGAGVAVAVVFEGAGPGLDLQPKHPPRTPHPTDFGPGGEP